MTEVDIKEYAAGIYAASSHGELLEFLRSYPLAFVEDAIEQAEEMVWDDWRKGIELERADKFAGIEWAERYGAISMPNELIRQVMEEEGDGK